MVKTGKQQSTLILKTGISTTGNIKGQIRQIFVKIFTDTVNLAVTQEMDWISS